MTAMTKTQRIAAERLSYHLWRADVEAAFDEAFIREQVPEAWHTLEADVDVEEPKDLRRCLAAIKWPECML